MAEHRPNSRLADVSATRLAWLDYAKGLGILLVVAGHANRSIERTSGLTWSDGLRLFDTLIYSFHMPLFFVLAGFAASLTSGKSAKDFARGLFWGMLLPYVVWSVVWIATKASLPGLANVPVDWPSLWEILWQPVEHMWFLFHLMIIATVWFALSRFDNPSLKLTAAILAAVASIVLRSSGSEWATLAFGLENFALFGFGALGLSTVLQFCERSPATYVIYAILAAGWLYAAHSTVGPGLAFASLPAAVLGSLAVIGLVRQLPAPQTMVLKGLAAIGQASLAIYLTHLFFIAAVRTLMSRAGHLDEWSLLIVGTVAGVGLPFVLYRAVQLASKSTGLRISDWIGFGPMREIHYQSEKAYTIRAEPHRTV